MKEESIEVNGIKFKHAKGMVEYNCFGCAFQDDKKGCDAANEVHECGKNIYKAEPIKSINEHEWSDDNILSVSIADDGIIEIHGDRTMYIDDEDLAVILNAKGCKMVKMEGE